VIVDCAHYRDGARQREHPMSIPEAAECAGRGDGFVWLGLYEPSDDEMEEVRRHFGLHELAVEDARAPHERAKLEAYDDDYFLVLRTARYLDEPEAVEFGEIHIFTGRGYAISVRHGEGSELGPARRALEARPDLLSAGPISVTWAVLDKVVDDYEPVVAGLETDIEEVEQLVFSGDVDQTRRIYLLKREVIEFYRAVHPLLAPLAAIERGTFPVVPSSMLPYYRDINDHAKLVHEEISSQRELLTSVLEANLAILSARQNEVVRKISAWAAIIAVPTLIASVYGMNFEHMPELRSEFGYPLAVAVMLATAIGLYAFFRRVRWLD
jgi:magnesium transporter